MSIVNFNICSWVMCGVPLCASKSLYAEYSKLWHLTFIAHSGFCFTGEYKYPQVFLCLFLRICLYFLKHFLFYFPEMIGRPLRDRTRSWWQRSPSSPTLLPSAQSNKLGLLNQHLNCTSVSPTILVGERNLCKAFADKMFYILLTLTIWPPSSVYRSSLPNTLKGMCDNKSGNHRHHDHHTNVFHTHSPVSTMVEQEWRQFFNLATPRPVSTRRGGHLPYYWDHFKQNSEIYSCHLREPFKNVLADFVR